MQHLDDFSLIQIQPLQLDVHVLMSLQPPAVNREGADGPTSPGTELTWRGILIWEWFLACIVGGV